MVAEFVPVTGAEAAVDCVVVGVDDVIVLPAVVMVAAVVVAGALDTTQHIELSLNISAVLTQSRLVIRLFGKRSWKAQRPVSVRHGFLMPVTTS